LDARNADCKTNLRVSHSIYGIHHYFDKKKSIPQSPVILFVIWNCKCKFNWCNCKIQMAVLFWNYGGTWEGNSLWFMRLLWLTASIPINSTRLYSIITDWLVLFVRLINIINSTGFYSIITHWLVLFVIRLNFWFLNHSWRNEFEMKLRFIYIQVSEILCLYTHAFFISFLATVPIYCHINLSCNIMGITKIARFRSMILEKFYLMFGIKF
jgi:hypothetical protein